jgi:hypothetical protein
MTTAETERVLVRRFSAYEPRHDPLFWYTPATGELRAAQDDVAGVEEIGWLVDREWVVRGEKRILLYPRAGRRFIVLGSTEFEIGEDKCNVEHYKSMLLSEFKVLSADGIFRSVKYVTPWWRLILDDGMFPELLFPLEFLAQRFLGCHTPWPRRATPERATP